MSNSPDVPAGAPIEIQVGGKTYKLSQWTMRKIGFLSARHKSNKAAGAYVAMKSVGQSELDCVMARNQSLALSLVDGEIEAALQSAENIPFIVSLSLIDHHPDMTEERVAALSEDALLEFMGAITSMGKSEDTEGEKRVNPLELHRRILDGVKDASARS